MASSQELARTLSSRSGIGFLLGILMYRLGEEYPADVGEYGIRFEGKLSRDLLTGTGSVITGELWAVFKSIRSNSMGVCFDIVSCNQLSNG